MTLIILPYIFLIIQYILIILVQQQLFRSYIYYHKQSWPYRMVKHTFQYIIQHKYHFRCIIYLLDMINILFLQLQFPLAYMNLHFCNTFHHLLCTSMAFIHYTFQYMLNHHQPLQIYYQFHHMKQHKPCC